MEPLDATSTDFSFEEFILNDILETKIIIDINRCWISFLSDEVEIANPKPPRSYEVATKNEAYARKNIYHQEDKEAKIPEICFLRIEREIMKQLLHCGAYKRCLK